jgi:hypothetical protein
MSLLPVDGACVAKMKRQSGNSLGEITIGSVTVRARWRYS